MGTVTSFVDGVASTPALKNHIIKVEKELDFGSTNVSSGDVVQALNIPASAFVMRAGVLVRTGEGSTCTATLGDGDDPNGWDDSVDLDSTGMYQNDLDSGTDAYGEGRYYSSADTIDLVMGNDASTAVVTVWALYFVMERTG